MPTGTQLPKINAGPVTFYVSADTVRPYVTRLMSADALKLTFVSRSKSRPEQYFIEFDGPAQFAGFSPLDSADRAILGISLIVDASAPFPVEHFDLSGIPTNVAPGDTTPTSCLADRASGDATANQQILWVASC